MPHEWMIDVLQDLRNFAAENQLAKLTEQLDDTIHIAVADIHGPHPNTTLAEPHADPNGSLPRSRGAV